MTTQVKSKFREMLPGLILIAGYLGLMTFSLLKNYVMIDYYQDKDTALMVFKKKSSGDPYYLLRTEDNRYYISKYTQEGSNQIDAINQGGVIYYKEGN